MKKNIIVVGSQYNRATIVSYTPKDKIFVSSSATRYSGKYLCRCECGTEKFISSNEILKKKLVNFCCNKKDKPKISMSSKLYNLGGTKIDALEIIHFDREKGKWFCKCECGNHVYRSSNALTTKLFKSRSCGCKRIKNVICGIKKHFNITSDRESFVKAIYRDYQFQAAKRKLEFNLTIEEFEPFLDFNCGYCGQAPSNKFSKHSFLYSGLDRIDNTKGYYVGNVLSACKKCNIKKSAMTQSDFREWIFAVHKHMTGQFPSVV